MIKAPHYTQFPNVIIDEYLKDLSLAELKVMTVIVRKTLGWHKEIERLSSGQIQKLTGLSKNAVKEGIRTLRDKGLILVERTGRGKGIKTYFELNVTDSEPLEDNNGAKNEPINPFNGSASNPTKDKRLKEKNINKDLYAEDVRLKKEEYEKLIKKGSKEIADKAIELLNNYKMAKGKKYKSDYHAILNWAWAKAVKETGIPDDENELPTHPNPDARY